MCSYIILSLLFYLSNALPECYMDCDMAKMVELQGHNLTADCRCWKACELDELTPDALKVVQDYDKVEPKHFKKVLYIRRDCREAYMAADDVEDVDLLLDRLWAPNGAMYQLTTEPPSGGSSSAPKDWVMAKANYHCPSTSQTAYVHRQLRFYRLKAFGGRAVYIHRDCNRVRYAYGLSTPEEAKQNVLNSLSHSNQVLNEWFLYDWNKEGFCSPLTHRVRREIRDLDKPAQDLFFRAMNDAYRRGIYHIHSPYHAQSLMYSFAHGTPGFTMYHRIAILNIEDQLRGLHPRNRCLTIPYWNWFRDPDPMKSTFFTPELVGSIENIVSQGNCGTGGSGCCVLDGHFAGWSDMYGQCLKRNFAEMPADKMGLPNQETIVDLITKYKTFGFGKYGFSIYTSGIVGNILDDCIVQCGDEADEKGTCTPLCHGLISTKSNRGFTGDLELSHNRVHFSVGGHMYASNSPYDPLFLLNHGMVDKVYTRWLQCHGKLDPFFWVTKEEHFADCYTVQGLYGLSDRILGWTLTISEGSFPRDIGATSYEYAQDQWEISTNLSSLCPGWQHVAKYEENVKKEYQLRGAMRFQNLKSLDDSPIVKPVIKSPFGSTSLGLLEAQNKMEKLQLRRRKLGLPERI